MDVEIHKHSSKTEHWINDRLTQNHSIENYISYSIKFNSDESQWVDKLPKYLESRNFIEGVHFTVTIFSGETSNGKTYYVVETNNKLCKQFSDCFDIYVIFKKLKETGNFV